MDVFTWGKQQSDREEEHNGTSGWFRPCRGCTENSRSRHWSPDKRRRTRGGGREGAREKKNKCHYWFGVETEQASADLQLTAAATRNKKKEGKKKKAASDCDPGVNMCSSH